MQRPRIAISNVRPGHRWQIATSAFRYPFFPSLLFPVSLSGRLSSLAFSSAIKTNDHRCVRLLPGSEGENKGGGAGNEGKSKERKDRAGNARG